MEQKNLPTIVGYFNTSFSPMYRSCRQKLNREMPNLAEFIHLTDLINIYKKFYLQPVELSTKWTTYLDTKEVLKYGRKFK